MKIVKLLFLTTSTWATSAFVIERKLLVYNEYWNKSLDVGIKLVGLDLAVRISINLEKWSLSMVSSLDYDHLFKPVRQLHCLVVCNQECIYFIEIQLRISVCVCSRNFLDV